MQYVEEKHGVYKQEIERLKKTRTENEELCNLLQELQKKTEYELIHPFNSVAFFKAKVYHTNEIKVLLGCDYFVERSTHQTLDILKRRIQTINKNLGEVEENLEAPGAVVDMGEGLEIIEPIEEDQPAPKETKMQSDNTNKEKGIYKTMFYHQQVEIDKQLEEERAKKNPNYKPEVQKTLDPIPTFTQTTTTNTIIPEKKKEPEKIVVEEPEPPKKLSKFKQDMLAKKNQNNSSS